MENKLDLAKLKTLIRDGIGAIPQDEHSREAIIVVGDTGVGKSTILNFLAGNKLTVKYQGLRPILQTQGNNFIKIGHDKFSETSIPIRQYIGEFAFYDCPGFCDNKGIEYEVSNSFFVQRLLDMYEKVKIILIIDESYLSEARVDKLPRLTKNLLRSFESFNDVKSGIMIVINRADPELEIDNYCRELEKLIQLKNQKGQLFKEEEKNLLRHIVQSKNIKLFKLPTKKDNGKQYVGGQDERNILGCIKALDFVKSKHILNIISESAKISIRDDIDDITVKSAGKMERLAKKVADRINEGIKSARTSIPDLMQIKERVVALNEELKNKQGYAVLDLLKAEMPEYDFAQFEQDFESIMFFKSIYDKTRVYFTNIVNKLFAELAMVLNKLHNRITKLQKDQEEEMERRRLQLKREEMKSEREREKFETYKQLREISNFRTQLEGNSRIHMLMAKQITSQMAEVLALMTGMENRLDLADEQLEQGLRVRAIQDQEYQARTSQVPVSYI